MSNPVLKKINGPTQILMNLAKKRAVIPYWFSGPESKIVSLTEGKTWKQKLFIRFGYLLFGKENVRAGATRMVWLRKFNVVKMPNVLWGLRMFLQGWVANISEHQNWRTVCIMNQSGHDIDYLAPVERKYFWGLVIVMTRAAEINRNMMPELCKDYALKHMDQFCTDAHANNFGVINGKFVIIDYAD